MLRTGFRNIMAAYVLVASPPRRKVNGSLRFDLTTGQFPEQDRPEDLLRPDNRVSPDAAMPTQCGANDPERPSFTRPFGRMKRDFTVGENRLDRVGSRFPGCSDPARIRRTVSDPEMLGARG